MTRTLRAFGALLALLALLAGVPTVLTIVGRVRDLGQIDWAGLLTSPVDGRMVVGIVSLLAWTAWLVVALTVVLEMAAVATKGRLRVRLPGIGWLQGWVATLVVSLAAAVLAAPMAAVPPAPPAPDPQPTSPEATSTVAPSVPEQEDTKPESAPATMRYAVRTGDDLWTLAQDLLGDGASWRVIAQLNPWLDPAAPLEAGSVLIVPEGVAGSAGRPPEPAAGTAPTMPEAAVPENAETSVTVRRGDTLWALAGTHLGDPHRWPEIYRLNTDRISDPDEIDIGWVLTLPTQTASTLPSAPATTAPALSPAPEPPISEADKSVPAPVVLAPVVPADADGGGVEMDTASAEVDQAGALVAGIGGALALGVLGLLAMSRSRQLAARGLGRRVRPSSGQALRMAEALGRVAEELPWPEPEPGPTAVVVGWAGDKAVVVDLERVGVLKIEGDPDALAGVDAAISSSLLCAPWSAGVEQVIVGTHECWTSEIDDPSVVTVDTATGVASLLRLVQARRAAMGEASLGELRSDADLAVAWQPTVFVFCERLTGDERATIAEACSAKVGVSAVLGHEPGAASGSGAGSLLVVTGSAATVKAMLDGRLLVPQLISSPARHALIELFGSTSSTDTEPAPWWSHGDDLPPNITPLRTSRASEEYAMDDAPSTGAASHPVLLLLGPLDLVGAAGAQPVRASRQCLEYCAWLLANPGRTASAMASDLLVAETTRRSNMSRLRSWLGTDPSGLLYLPEAYTGRIQLHPEVSSDWEQFCLLTSAGINRMSVPALRRALGLVRGAPLADAAPWQWQWAEPMRTDMISAIEDAAIVLAEHALKTGDVDLAMWAIERGQVASPEDELLEALQAVTLQACGCHEEAERVVRQLTRRARAEGIDLGERTVSLVQRVVEGRVRARLT